jgi:hypothetical protein
LLGDPLQEQEINGTCGNHPPAMRHNPGAVRALITGGAINSRTLPSASRERLAPPYSLLRAQKPAHDGRTISLAQK